MPTSSKLTDPKMEYEVMSGAIFWEDEGLLELKNHHLQHAFQHVINHRMKRIVGPQHNVGCMRSLQFDRQIFEMAKRFYPDWIGFDESRCSYNPVLADRILRIKKVAAWRVNKFLESD